MSRPLPNRPLTAAVFLALASLPALAQDNGNPTAPLQPGNTLVPFVLPWNDATPGVTDVSGLIEKPAGQHGTIQVKNGHFYAGDSRIRFFGVNLCFAASFPTHDQADQIAARMAKFGINCVRFHHMDTSPSPSGLVKADRKTIDPAQLERLDYLISRLKDHGIYSNLNLHVGRPYPGHKTWPGGPGYFKGIDNVDSSMIRDQMQYAKDLLTHVNPYTRQPYTTEPAVAIVEINNENSLFNEWSGGGLDELPDPYSADLRKRWNEFLKTAHNTDDALRKAWNIQSQPPGKEMLANGGFDSGDQSWYFEQHSGSSKHQITDGHVVLTVEQPSSEPWHIQFNQSGLKLDSNSPYTLTFRACSSENLRLAVNIGQAHEPWHPLYTTEVAVGPEWKDYSVVFLPSDSDPNGRVSFSNLGRKPLRFQLDDVHLATGGLVGLREGESLGSIDWFRHNAFASRTPEAQRDWIRFLWSLEDWYWSGMYEYVKTTLRTKAVVLGTQMGWSPATVQAKLDAIDSHSYWQHPHFPNRQWDMNDWRIQNIPMAGRKDGGTLPRLGLSRVEGKPFLCTEYNHSAPNTYGSEGFLLVAAYAARQDWDAIFAFAYSHRGENDWAPGKITSFFDIDQSPAKMATLPAVAALFLRGDVPPAHGVATVKPTADQWIEAGRKHGAWGIGAAAFGLTDDQALTRRVGLIVDSVGGEPQNIPPDPADAKTFAWTPGPDDKTGVVTIDTPRSKAVIGSIARSPFSLGDVTIALAPNRQSWAAVTLTAVDGPDFHSPGRILITTTGDHGNTGMRWHDPERTTIGTDWGQGPSLVEAIPATITLPVPAPKLKAWPLDEKGQRRTDTALKVTASGNASVITLGPDAQTLWYEVEISK